MERINGIKILLEGGLHGPNDGAAAQITDRGSNCALFDQRINPALKYCTQAPLMDNLLSKPSIPEARSNLQTRLGPFLKVTLSYPRLNYRRKQEKEVKAVSYFNKTSHCFNLLFSRVALAAETEATRAGAKAAT